MRLYLRKSIWTVLKGYKIACPSLTNSKLVCITNPDRIETKNIQLNWKLTSKIAVKSENQLTHIFTTQFVLFIHLEEGIIMAHACI